MELDLVLEPVVLESIDRRHGVVARSVGHEVENQFVEFSMAITALVIGIIEWCHKVIASWSEVDHVDQRPLRFLLVEDSSDDKSVGRHGYS